MRVACHILLPYCHIQSNCLATTTILWKWKCIVKAFKFWAQFDLFWNFFSFHIIEEAKNDNSKKKEKKKNNTNSKRKKKEKQYKFKNQTIGAWSWVLRGYWRGKALLSLKCYERNKKLLPYIAFLWIRNYYSGDILWESNCRQFTLRGMLENELVFFI